jgi:hypothetical protein
MPRRPALIVAIAALVGLTATAMSQQPLPIDPGAVAPGVPQQVTLRPGDSMVVDGVPIGCAVTTRSGSTVIECGRTGGKIAGTYMSIIGSRKLKVARLRSPGVAKIILTATHHGGWRACGKSATAVRAGASGCR